MVPDRDTARYRTVLRYMLFGSPWSMTGRSSYIWEMVHPEDTAELPKTSGVWDIWMRL